MALKFRIKRMGSIAIDRTVFEKVQALHIVRGEVDGRALGVAYVTFVNETDMNTYWNIWNGTNIMTERNVNRLVV